MSTSEIVSPEMRRRLLSNRDGKLTGDQWLAVTFAPVVPLLLLIAPAAAVLAGRAGRLGVLVSLLGGLALIVYVVVNRAYRYARLALHYEEMTAIRDFPQPRLFSVPEFADERDELVTFKRRYGSDIKVTNGTTYGIYYLVDGYTPVLLSLAPVEHPDKSLWKPSRGFDLRRQRRAEEKPKRKPKRERA